jgi:RimJ/RimL family protein N-acetyltransferase
MASTFASIYTTSWDTTNPVVMEFFTAPLAPAESDALADRIRSGIAENGWGLWAVEIQDVAPFIGFVGLSRATSSVPIAPCIEIGWRLGADHWGKGYASEAALAALDYGFNTLNLDEIVSFTAATNNRSRTVMERIGMTFAAETFEHPRVPEGNPLRTHVVYRLTGAKWQSGA